jgi:type II secretory pathway pseudopilin PulG
MLNSKNKYKNSSAFTLVELAIVLVILSLGIVGIIQGSGMLNSYRTQVATSTLQKYKSAIDEFKSKYQSWPGDMPDAESVWVPAVGTSTARVKNGDGNGFITTGLTAATPNAVSEEFQAWYQLSLSGYLSGAYTGQNGTSSTVTYSYKTGTNVPEASFPASVFRLYSNDTDLVSPALVKNVNGAASRRLVFIDMLYANNASANGGIVQPSTAEIIDKKMDDGQANSGRVRGENAPYDQTGTNIPAGSTCLNAGAYRLTVTTNTNIATGCIVRYIVSTY